MDKIYRTHILHMCPVFPSHPFLVQGPSRPGMRRTYRFFTVLRTIPRCAAFAESAGDGTFVAARLASKPVAGLAGWPGILLQIAAICKRLLRGRGRFSLLNLRLDSSSSS